MPADVRRGADAFRTSAADRSTTHAFSFGAHYDPANLGFGPLVVHNDDRVAAGGGYPDHGHTDVEIVTWVLDGALTHTDTTAGADRGAGSATLGAGTVQVTSAGSGIRHSELVDPAAGATRFLQAWVRPDERGATPRTTRAVPDPADLAAGLVPVAGGPDAPPVGTRGAVLWVGRPRAGVPLRLPDAPLLHLYVARGAVVAPEGAVTLAEGDAWRLRDAGEVVVAPQDHRTELVVWSFGAVP